jgi:hypothetical protein
LVWSALFAGAPFQSSFGLQSAGQGLENVFRAAARPSRRQM